MSIVTLEDGTIYYIDTDKSHIAKEVVSYKLNQRLDYRKIKDINIIEGVLVDKKGKYYNSDKYYDNKKLVAVKGIAYGWK